MRGGLLPSTTSTLIQPPNRRKVFSLQRMGETRKPRRRGRVQPMSLLKYAILKNAKENRIPAPYPQEVYQMLTRPRKISRRENLLKYHLRAEKRGFSYTYQLNNSYQPSKKIAKVEVGH